MKKNKKNIPQYFEANPESPSRPGQYSFSLEGENFVFATDSGMFSKDGPDAGSLILLKNFLKDYRPVSENKTESLLDLGSAYGFIGLTVKRFLPDLKVSMMDINARAVEYARKNARANKLEIEEIVKGDALEGIGENYDLILFNPPIRSGKKNVFFLYEQAHRHLNSGGRLYIVIRTSQGAAGAMAKLTEIFGSCELLKIKSGYRVFKAVKGD